MQRLVQRPLKIVQHWLAVLAFALLAMPGLVYAQTPSACTAMWGLVSNSGGTGVSPAYLAYFNNSPGNTAAKWTTISFAIPFTGTGPNALAGEDVSTNPRLFYFRRDITTTFSVNLNTLVSTTVGTITPNPPGATTAAILGAVINSNGDLIVLSAQTNFQVAIISKTGPTVGAVWRTITQAGLVPVPPQSGDIFIDPTGNLWLTANSGSNVAVYPLTIVAPAGGPITSASVGTSISYAVGGTGAAAGSTFDPVSGRSFFGGTTAGALLYSFTPGVAGGNTLIDTTGPGVFDMGNCATRPAEPSVTKAISPAYQPGAGITTTLTINIANPNWASIFLPVAFSDVFPAGMTIASVPNLTSNTNCVGVISAPPGSTSITFQAGGRILGGPSGATCTFSVSVVGITSTTALTNTIPSGSLTTTAGTNTLAVTATFKVGTDFSAQKLQATSTGVLTAASVTFGASQPVLYQLNIVNSAVGGTGSATFTDTLPTQITPVLSVTAVHSGGGSCTTASAVVGGRTIITGTVTNALAGSTCTVTVQGRATSTLVASTAIVNTLTLAALPGTSDTNSSNNRSTVTAGVTPGTVLTITKTNVITTLVAGQTTSYTVTVSNLGPAAATGAIVTDPVAPGLACTAITCNVAGGAVCPGGLTPATFSTGAVIGTFPPASTLTFTLRCNVTATGR